MFTQLRRIGWHDQFEEPHSAYEYIRHELGIEIDHVGEMAAYEEIPEAIRRAVISCTAVEKNAGKPIDLKTVARIAEEHGVPMNPVAMCLGWFPPPTIPITELEATSLRLAAEIDLRGRSKH